jgi:S-DNA-T family DNA segregation ATPase FtsK/SpoIIIE
VGNSIRKEAIAIFFLTLGLFLTVALVSFDQLDPSLSTWNSFDAPVHNWGGRIGAVLADLLLQSFGIGAVGFPILCIGLAWWTYHGEGMGGKWTRALGGLLAVCCLLGGLSFFTGHVRIFGQGVFLPGIVGLPGVNLFGRLLNTVGGILCLSAMFLLSLMLLTGSSLSGLPSLWRRDKHGDELRAAVKERLVPRDDEWEKAPPRKEQKDAPRDRAKEASPRIVVATRPIDEAPRNAGPAGKAFVLPSLDFLEPAPPPAEGADDTTLRRNAESLLEMLRQHGIEGAVTEIRTGPLVTTYEFRPAPGVKIARVAALANDLALAMKCEAVRVVPNIPGKGVMGFEIPNDKRSKIVLREILGCRAFADSQSLLTIAIGKDLFGEPIVRDLARMPHLMIAGATGAGKSVGMNSMILSILYRATPEEVRFLMIDPKMVELSPYDGIPHLRHPVVTDPRAAAGVLRWAVGEMNGRYQLLSECGVRHIDAYNQGIDKKLASRAGRAKAGAAAETDELARLPYIVIVIDELADLMMGTASRREVEALIIMLAQKARAVGIHLIVATQRPSVDVITGLMKTNFPARISYKVTSVYDSKTILDHGGSETLLGNGDMLFLQPGAAGLIRVHGPFVGDEEVQKVVEHLKSQGAPVYDESIAAAAAGADEEEADATQDPLFEKALEEVRRAGRCSVSMIQRKLSIGYNRAARIVEAMERMGFVGPSEGGKPREVYAPRD